MKKVGLITYHNTTNFGSLLQTFALYTVVSSLGFDCEVMDYHNKIIDKKERARKLSDCRTIKEVYYYFIEKGKRKKVKNFQKFLNQELKLSDVCYDRNNVEKSLEKYDVFLVGSDLVWDFTINKYDTTYMLDFVKDKTKKKIAYASSTGSEWEQKETVIELLADFDHIGVREKSIQRILTEWLNTSVDFVCDPTMLIEPSFWKKRAAKRIIGENYVVCYFHDKENLIYREACEYGKKNRLPVYVITIGKAPKGCKAVRPWDIWEFLSVILYAETVFTASYHGMLFALYFEKNMYFYNRGYKSRMESLANLVGIERREHLGDETPIDYFYVNEALENFRNKSKDILIKYLTE